MDLAPDWIDLLEEFGRSAVEYVIVGGYAVAFHGRPRATKDIDLVLEGSDGNLARAAEALARFGAPSNVVAAVHGMAPTDVVFMGQPPLRIDFLRSIEAVEPADLFAHAVPGTVGGVAVRVISLNDLITNKSAVGRRQDLLDVAFLERVRARSRG